MGNIVEIITMRLAEFMNWFVDKAIKATVIGHLFGDESSLLNASIDTTIREDQSESADVQSNNQNDLESMSTSTGVKDRMKMFEMSNNQDNDVLNKPARQRPKSKAFEMFENKGIIITQMPHVDSADVNHDESEEEEEFVKDQQGFEKIRRTSDPLQNFKKPAGPPNRRSPSRKLRRNSMETDEEIMDQQEDHEKIPNGTLKQNGVIGAPKPRERRDGELNQNDARERIAFLDIRQEASNKANASPDKSPLLGAKPFVPPLDFSTLHENIGGQAPIPAQKAQSVSYQRASVSPHSPFEDEDKEQESPSPHSSKIKRKAGFIED